MTFCTPTNNALYFTSVDEIPSSIWEELQCTGNVYFHSNYLKSLEEHNLQIDFSYIVLINDLKKPIALATLQILDIPIDVLENSLNNSYDKLKCFSRKFFFKKQQPLKILVCGDTFVSGEHGVFIKKTANKKKVIHQLAEAISHFANKSKKHKNSISAFILKDFIQESLLITNELHTFKYYSFNVEPNMVFLVNTLWQNFDDYLASMKTKFRVKAKKALKQSAHLIIKDVSLKNIEEFLPKMTRLYKNVSVNSDFNLGDFNLNTYRSFKEKLGNHYILKTYWINDKLVGFLSGIINKNTLDAHFVGIDYKRNRECAIYQRMLYDYIKIGIENKLEIINFGRTASEIKSSVGAIPQHLTVYIRHKKTIKNHLLKLFLQKIEPTPFQQKFPFKKV